MAKKTSIISEGAQALEQAFKEAQAIKKAAKGPALPLNLKRAAPKTKQELQQEAERVSRQMMGEHVTSGKKGDTKNLAGRSMKESQRVKGLDYKLTPTKELPEVENYTPRMGEVKVAIPGDQTVSDRILEELEGLAIGSEQQGGSLYGLGKMDRDNPLFWASNEGPAGQLQGKIDRLSEYYNTDQILGEHLAMGNTANNFAQHMADANLKAFNSVDLHPAAIEKFNEIIREGYKIKNPKTGDYKVIQFPHFPGIENPAESYLAMKMDPEMRKFFNARAKTPSVTEPLGLPSGLDVEYAVTEPALRDMEINLTGRSVGRMKPGEALTDDPDHDTYLKGIVGDMLGQREVLQPFKIAYPDATDYVMATQRPQDFTGTIQKIFPHQKVDQQYIDEYNTYRDFIKKYTGKAKGGKVGKAAGILEELNKAYEEAKALKTLAPKVEAPTIIVPKRGKIKDIQDKVRKERGDYAARRVERAADEVPNLEHQYTQRALEKEFTASNPQALMVLNPKDFEEFAHPLSPTLIGRTENYGGFNVPEDMSYDQYIEYLASIARDQGLTDVPYLRINETPEGELIIGGHEGRHRTRALSKLGDESTLISLDPSYSLTTDEARRYKEDYIDALNARFGLDRLITPEYRPDVKGEVKRSPIIMPDLFAEGGKVNKLEQEFVNADTVHMAEGGWNSPYATKNKKSPTQPMSMPDLDTLALTGKILAKKGKQQLKKELANPSPQMAVDVLGNVGADLLGMPADMIESARGTPMKGYKPFKGVDLTPKGTPMLGSENLRGQLEKAGITSGEERPLTENLAMMGLPFAGELKGLPAGLSIKDVSAAAEEAKRAVNFVSSVERTIKGHKMDAMPGNQWSAWMKSNASKAAKKEADATGLHDWLSQQTGKVTKADIEAYVEGNLPKVKVVEKGAPLKLNSDERKELEDLTKRHSRVLHGADNEPLSDDDYNKLIKLANIDEMATVQNLRNQARQTEKIAQQAQQRGDKYTALVNFGRSEHLSQRADQLELEPLKYGGSKFEQYTLPGGSNYKETMLSIPRKHVPEYTYDVHGYSPKTGFKTREEAQAYADEQTQLAKDLREKAKTVDPSVQDAMNRAIDNMEDFPHQVVESESPISRSKNPDFIVPRAHIYDDPETDYNRLAHLRTNERMTPEQRRVLFLEELQSDWAQQAREQGFRQDIQKLTDAEELRFQELLEDGRRNLEGDKLAEFESLLAKRDAYASNSNIPRGPYVEDTKDWTALGLKHALKKAAEEGQDYMAWTTGQQQADRYSLAQYLDNVRATKNPDGTYSFMAYEKDASRDNLPTIRQEGLTEDELSQHLGKDMAKKIVGDLAEARPTQVANYNNLDLQIGGEGMKGYYDQIVPSTMNDVLKQIGAKERVKPIDVHMEKGFVGEDHPDFGIPTTSQHLGIEITPELRELILNEGLPHFHDGGNVQYNPVNLNEEFKKSRYGV